MSNCVRRALTYKTEEVQLTAVDEVYVEQTHDGHVLKHVCRVRVFFLSFLSGMPEVELGVNDMTRIGLEVGNQQLKYLMLLYCTGGQVVFNPGRIVVRPN